MSRIRKFRVMERRFLRLYSAWQETHRLELAQGCIKLLGELLKLNPSYSLRHPFERAF